MPRRTMFGYEDILKGAYSVLEREGLPAVTAVSVATEVGCSTMPIFWLFHTINDLRNETLKASIEYLVAEVKKPRGNNLFGDVAMAMCLLARDKPNVFKALFFEQQQSGKLMSTFHKWVRDRVRKVDFLAAIRSDEAYQETMNALFSLVFGYASQIVLGTIKNPKDDQILKAIQDLVTPYYEEHITHKGKNLYTADELRKQVQKHVAARKAAKESDDEQPLFPSSRKQPAKAAAKPAAKPAKPAKKAEKPAPKAAKKAPAKKQKKVAAPVSKKKKPAARSSKKR
ncbi:MAG TPA: hypothetical protein VIV61_03240 [Candidatus Ozemobacteraceae bacterium]